MHDKHIAADHRERKPVVVFLHGSASSPRQWQPYMERFALRYRAVAPPLIGYQLGSDWRPGNPERTASVEREAALLEPWLYLAAEGAHLVGHAYGAAVALHAALRYPGRVRSVVAYEPVLFNLLAAEGTVLAGYREVRAPVLCLYGSQTRGATRRVARLLWAALPRVDLMELPGMGHLGPITHPDEVGGLVQRHIDAQAPARPLEHPVEALVPAVGLGHVGRALGALALREIWP